jgi:hypothetical protein
MKNFDENYLTGLKKQFEYYKLLGERSFDQLNEEELFWSYNESSNSIAVMVNHLWGNMMSRWTDFLTTDGEKEWRERDLEFEEIIGNREEMMRKWNEGWACLFTALDTVNKENIDQTVYIRNQEHSIPEAINRQLAHYAYHVGQIVYVARMIRDQEWMSLSIPKGQSATFNEKKFSEEKKRTHITDEFLDPNPK